MTQPKGAGIYARIERFFTENPDEILLVDDICLKFDITRKQAYNHIWKLEKRGGILRVVGNELRGMAV